MAKRLFAEFGTPLLHYKNETEAKRKQRIVSLISNVHRFGSTVTNHADCIERYTMLCHAATLINYANVLNQMEHQHYFDILSDFARMPLSEELAQYFEWHPSAPQMRLTCPIQVIPMPIWLLFRNAQEAHLHTIGKSHDFHLDELDPYHPPKNQLYPLPIQMGARLYNEAVDRISVNAEGLYRFVQRHGRYLLPGGGMVEKGNRPAALLHKLLEEHLEEEHANLYLKAGLAYDAIEPIEFNHIVSNTIRVKKMPAFSNEFINQLRQAASFNERNSLKLQHMIALIDLEIQKTADQYPLKALRELRAAIQVNPFGKTCLFNEALEYLKQHSLCIDIPQYLDSRVLGGFQLSHSFIIKGLPLEEWFQNRFHGIEGAFGDDLTGVSIKPLTFLHALTAFRRVKFSHLLIVLACHIEHIRTGRLNELRLWDPEQFKRVCQEISIEGTRLL